MQKTMEVKLHVLTCQSGAIYIKNNMRMSLFFVFFQLFTDK